MIEHKNRVPGAGKTNRKLITPEGGGAAFNAVVTFADNPVDVGTPVTKAMLDEFLAASGTTTGTSSALVLAQAGFALVDGAPIHAKVHVDINGACTLNVNNQGAKSLFDSALKSPTGIKAGTWVTAIYSNTSTAYILQGGSAPYQVGDTKQSVRTDIGIDWLLCNGSMIDETTYPDLAPLFTSSEVPWSSYQVVVNSAPTMNRVVYGNGYYVYSYRSSTGYASIKYATAISGPWTELSWTYTIAPSNVVWDGTRFSFLQNNGSNYISLYATNPTVLANWTTVTINSTVFNNLINYKYVNGYYVVFGSYYDGSGVKNSVFYSSSITVGTGWSVYVINSGSLTYDGAYGGGYWVVTSGGAGVFYATSLGGPYTWKSVGAGVNRAVEYIDGNFILKDAYASNPTGTWTTLSTPNIGVSASDGTGGIIKFDGYYVIYGRQATTTYPYIYYSTSLSGTWVGKGLNTATTDSVLGLSECNGNLVAMWWRSSGTVSGLAYTPKIKAKYLPTISTSGVYNYIKAL